MLTLSLGCPIHRGHPTGVDTEQYQAGPSLSGNPPLIVFTGSMDWEPNIDAMEYFCHEIWPLILTEYPDARFQIVGRSPCTHACSAWHFSFGRSHRNCSFRHRVPAIGYSCDRASTHRRRDATQDF